jgi:hypothetical protein
MLATWEQSPTFDPYNPNQIIREVYTGIPGGYGSFYFNKVPTTTSLNGALGSAISGLPAWGQVLVVGGLAAVIGFVGFKAVGPKLKNLAGLGRPGRRRRR